MSPSRGSWTRLLGFSWWFALLHWHPVQKPILDWVSSQPPWRARAAVVTIMLLKRWPAHAAVESKRPKETSAPPTQRLGNQPLHPQVEDSLLKRRTCTYNWKHQPAYSFTLYGAPPPPPLQLFTPIFNFFAAFTMFIVPTDGALYAVIVVFCLFRTHSLKTGYKRFLARFCTFVFSPSPLPRRGRGGCCGVLRAVQRITRRNLLYRCASSEPLLKASAANSGCLATNSSWR